MTSMRPVVEFGSRSIGDGHACFVIAEAGSNHMGNLEVAKRLIALAASAGADGVKFQVFRAGKLYPKNAGASAHLKINRPIFEITAEVEMPYGWLPELAGECQRRGVLFLASVFDEQSADHLDPHVKAFKIASYEVTHLPLLQHVARKGKPVVLSTGTADLGEVEEAVEAFRATGNDQLILMQCTAAYPAPLEALNIRAIQTLKAAFGVPVGLSDHSRDPLVGPLTAVAAGANLFEKHFSFSNELPGPDHSFAVEPTELRLMIQRVREVEAALGNGKKVAHPVEAELRAFDRRSIFAVSDIAAGEEFTLQNIAVLRAGTLPPGLPPRQFPDVLVRRAAHDIPAGVAIQPEHLR